MKDAGKEIASQHIQRFIVVLFSSPLLMDCKNLLVKIYFVSKLFLFRFPQKIRYVGSQPYFMDPNWVAFIRLQAQNSWASRGNSFSNFIYGSKRKEITYGALVNADPYIGLIKTKSRNNGNHYKLINIYQNQQG